MLNQASSPNRLVGWLTAVTPLVALCAAFGLASASAQTISAPLTVTTLAGSAGVRQVTDGTGSAARFYAPTGLAIDGSGNLIVADSANNVFRKVTTGGVVALFSGQPMDPSTHPINIGSADGSASSASFYIGQFASSGGGPWGTPIFVTPGSVTLGVDSSGNIYFADTNNDTIRKLAPDGTASTIAGAAGNQGTIDGTGTGARFNSPGGVAVDSAGNIYVADSGNDTIRKITPAGVVTTLAGTARAFGSSDGTGAAARFSNPSGVAVDSSGNLYVTDSANHTIRKITSAGVVTTLAGSAGNKGSADGGSTQARFNSPQGIAVDSSGNVYVADTENHTIRKISPSGTVTTIAGTAGTAGSADGTGTGASFDEPYGVTVDASGNVYVADTTNDTIRKGVPATGSGSLQVTGVPPSLIQVTATQNVTLKIVASGSPSPSYQWYKDGAAVSGATSDTLQLNSVTSANAGNYSVVVTSGVLTYSSALTQVQVFAQGTSVPSVAIITQPTDQTVAAGHNASFTVQASSSGTLTYQWTKNGTNITGATSATYTISSAQSTDAGTYAVNVSDGSSTATTSGAYLTVTGGTASVAPQITTQPSTQSVTAGTTVTFTAAASGTPAPTYQWQKDGSALTDNATISGSTTATLTITNVTSTNAGNYTVVATNTAGSVVSNVASLTISSTQPSGPTAWLSNLSVRANMASGQTMIVGFTVAGGAQNVLVRAGGPALANTFPQYFSTSSVMADPRLAYYPSGSSTATATNDNWDSSLSTTFDSVGAFPFVAGSKDAAFVQSIDGPNNTVWVQGTGAGYVLVEGYGLGTTNSPRLTNISARNHVGTGADILIAGFVIKGSGTKRLLIRGIGPRLNELFGITGVLADPKLEIYDSSGTKIAENNDWDSSLSTTFDSVGAYSFTPGSKDSAIVVTLAANASYTAQVKGNDGGTGEAVVEVYELP